MIGIGWERRAADRCCTLVAADRCCTLVATGMVEARLTVGTVTAVMLPPALLRRKVVT